MNELKTAEKKASGLVAKAREDRNNKLKEAKIDADKLIAKHRAEKESQYQALVQAKASSNLSAGTTYIYRHIMAIASLTFIILLCSDNYNANIATDINKMTMEFNSNKDAVEKMLMDIVTTVNLK